MAMATRPGTRPWPSPSQHLRATQDRWAGGRRFQAVATIACVRLLQRERQLHAIHAGRAVVASTLADRAGRASVRRAGRRTAWSAGHSRCNARALSYSRKHPITQDQPADAGQSGWPAANQRPNDSRWASFSFRPSLRCAEPVRQTRRDGSMGTRADGLPKCYKVSGFSPLLSASSNSLIQSFDRHSREAKLRLKRQTHTHTYTTTTTASYCSAASSSLTATTNNSQPATSIMLSKTVNKTALHPGGIV
jgi:hypothetical protein